jgi:ketosteroid isomerase-like protein
MLFEVHELEIEAGQDIAFGHYLSRCGTVGDDGKEQVGHMRGTFCCRRTGGGWKIAHEHFSAPFDPESGKALFDLAP